MTKNDGNNLVDIAQQRNKLVKSEAAPWPTDPRLRLLVGSKKVAINRYSSHLELAQILVDKFARGPLGLLPDANDREKLALLISDLLDVQWTLFNPHKRYPDDFERLVMRLLR